MSKFKCAFQVLVLVGLFFAFSAVTANAQATRTWVSGVGDDANPCSRTAPCKTFAGAISKTAEDGEIDCLDPAGYGTVTITKSITIDCQDVGGSILNAGTNGVIINITSATDTEKAVRLRGISISGASTGTNGIRILSANYVFIEDVLISGNTVHGISAEPASGTTARIIVDGATISNNNGNGFNAFIVSGAAATLSVNNSTFSANNIGFNLSQTLKATFQNSIITGNNTGVLVNVSDLTMTNCQVSHNTTGVQAGSGGTIRLSNNSIAANGTGLSGSTIISYGNNVISGNTTNGSPTSVVPLN